MKAKVGRSVILRQRYKEKPLFRRICKCGCGKTFFTSNKATKFKNIAHFNSFRLKSGIKRKYRKRKKYVPKFKLNKPYRDKPYLVAQRGIYAI